MSRVHAARLNERVPQKARPILAALLVAFPLLNAEAAGSATPGAGTILQQIQPTPPPSPSPNGTGLTIERGSGQQLPPSAPFPVVTIRIVGNTKFGSAVLHALVADAEGKTLTLSQLGSVAARIGNYYHQHGYPLARAVIPAQTIWDGVVTIEVIEARYGKIKLDNRSRVNEPLLQDTLSLLQSGQVIGEARLNHALLLLSDIPGVEVGATFRPGDAVGTSDLQVDTTAGPALVGTSNVVLDNFGNRYTGRARLGGTVSLINPLHHGDVLTVSGLSSGKGVNYASISYELLLNGRGTRVGGSYSALRYTLRETLADLDANGTAQVASVWLRQPIIRTRDVNLYGEIQLDRLQLRDHIDSGDIRTDRHMDIWTASLSGDARDELLPGSVDSWNLGLTGGRVGFDDPAAQMSDAATAHTHGGFSKWTASLAHLQRLSARNTLYISLSGQWANDNLDPSEKMIAGGPYTVRAYDIGAASGDTGYIGTAELRHDLGAWNGEWQAIAFVDGASVTVNKTAWAAGTNIANLYGAGVGLNWAGPDRWSIGTSVAARVGPVPALVADNSSVHAWIELSKGF